MSKTIVERDEQLLTMLRESVDLKGMDAVKEHFQLVLAEYERLEKTFVCAKCESRVDLKSTVVVGFLSVCGLCRTKNFVFDGKARTFRSSGREGYRRMCLRFFDGSNEQRLLEFVDRSRCGSRFEIKSKDDFTVAIAKDKKGSEYKFRISVENKTTGRVYLFSEANIHDFDVQFPDILMK